MESRRQIDPRDVLSDIQTLPHEDAANRLQRLVGLEEQSRSLARDLHQLWHPHLARRDADVGAVSGRGSGVGGTLADVDVVVCASGSSGTHAGLVTGFHGCNMNVPVLGIDKAWIEIDVSLSRPTTHHI